MVRESEIQADILLALGSKPAMYVERRNAGAFMGVGGMVRAGVAGVADILVVYEGRAIALEVTTPTGRLRPAQRRWRLAWGKAGGEYYIVRCVADANRAIYDTA